MRRPLRGRRRTFDVLLRTSRTISASLDFEKATGLILRECRKALRADHASLFLVDAASGKLTLVRADGFSKDKTDNIRILGGWEAVNEHVLLKRRPLIVNDLSKSPAFKGAAVWEDGPFPRERLPTSSFLAVPLKKEDGTIVGVLIVSNRARSRHRFTGDDTELLVALSYHVAIALLNAKLYESLKNLFISTVVSLTKAVDAKDTYTCGHSERVMKYAVAIGKVMRLGDDDLENLRLSALLHDVGKIGISEAILSKPSKLESRERALIKRHPLIGAEIVRSIDNAHRITDGIAQHHERYDGKGYPKGLKGREISWEGRIIAVADTFDALTTKRPYQQPYSPKEAFFVIMKGSGVQFDPAVVKAFTTSFSTYPLWWGVK